jgi:hypothetical protein
MNPAQCHSTPLHVVSKPGLAPDKRRNCKGAFPGFEILAVPLNEAGTLAGNCTASKRHRTTDSIVVRDIAGLTEEHSAVKESSSVASVPFAE